MSVAPAVVDDEQTVLARGASRRGFLKNSLGVGAGVAACGAGTLISPNSPKAHADTISVNESAYLYFDGGAQFTGDDATKWGQYIAWLKNHGGGAGGRPSLQLPARVVNTPQLPELSGMHVAGAGASGGEWGTGTTVKYAGAAGSSLFTEYSNPGYGYPSGGLPRDIKWRDVEFYSGSGQDFFKAYPAKSGFVPSAVKWSTVFLNCGWVGWNRIMHGWGDGVLFSGETHLQAGSNTAFCVGGSENFFFGDGSFVDSSSPFSPTPGVAFRNAGLPLMEMIGDKWTIGGVMITACNTAYHLLVSSGRAGRCIGTYFDAQDSAPTVGPQVRITGGDGMQFTACNFKGGHGLSVSGGTSVDIQGNTFRGNPEVLTVADSFQGQVLLGLNQYVAGTPKVVKVARLNQIICLDPRVTIHNLSGGVLKAATA